MNVYKFLLTLHANANTNVTTDAGMSVEMKTYYDKVLLKNAWAKLVHNQFGQKRPLPKGGGKIIEFRKFTPLPKALTPLSEGVTPDGQKIAATSINATIDQYGDYFTYSDMLKMTTIDPVVQEGTELLGHQSGETVDTITRETLNGGHTVQHGDGSKDAREELVAFNSTWANNDYFDCETIRMAMLTLRNNKARPIRDGKMVCIIHPELEYCLKKDTEWSEAQKYAGSERIFQGEIGEFDGCKFVVSTEAKIWSAPALAAAGRTLTFASVDATDKIFTVDEKLTADDKAAMEGRKVWCDGTLYTIATVTAGAAGVATIAMTEAHPSSKEPAVGSIIYPGDMGKDLAEMPNLGAEVGSALFLGADAYGVTELEGMGLETIVKQLGSGGSTDPLNQRGTVGWKATHVAKVLSELWLVRAECTIPHMIGAN